MKIKVVVLCGGSGTRLWPLSRSAYPKQFVPLIQTPAGPRSLLQQTLARVRRIASDAICVTNEDHRFIVKEAMEESRVPGFQILEPVGRNTAAAITCAALNCEEGDLMLCLPSDHYMPDMDAFQAATMSAIGVAEDGYILTFGVVPGFPSTAYGYIREGEEIEGHANVRAVERFVEKPAAAIAEQMLREGGYYWNAGVFLATVKTYIEAMRSHAPDILASCEKAVAGQTRDGTFIRLAETDFRDCRSESIDYAVMEKHDRVAVVPLNGAWSDVGSWRAVAELAPSDSEGNSMNGPCTFVDSSNTFIHSPKKRVVAIGTNDLVIVDTVDALLVADINKSDIVKDVVQELRDSEAQEATLHRRVVRPWGAYDSIDAGERFQVKRITVNPGGKLSLQMHHHRAEHWIVVRGTAKVTRGSEVFMLGENESTFIPLGVVHRLENPGKVPLELIEVQSGSYLGEDDIVRYEDTYGRVEPK